MITPPLELVFGRSQLAMSTREHVEVLREAAAPGERRRYTKRCLATPKGDFRPWIAREWRILQYLSSHSLRCVPVVAAFDAQAVSLQTFDAGVTVDHWARLVPVQRDGHLLPHAFADCAHWWALAHHTLRALESLHVLDVVHLDVKPDNICVPVLPANFTPDAPHAPITLKFARLALIDFAFALLPAEPLPAPLPIAPDSDYAYQSPRLLSALAAGKTGDLGPTRALDWRCDLFGLAAMLRRYLPASTAGAAETGTGWTGERHERALGFLAALDAAHDGEVTAVWPHQALIQACEAEMQDEDLVAALLQGFRLAPGHAPLAPAAAATPATNIQLPVTDESTRARAVDAAPLIAGAPVDAPHVHVRSPERRWRASAAAATVLTALAVVAGLLATSRLDQKPTEAVVASAADSQTTPAVQNAPKKQEAATSAALASNTDRDTAPRAPSDAAERRSGDLAIDAATVQRAADVELQQPNRPASHDAAAQRSGANVQGPATDASKPVVAEAPEPASRDTPKPAVAETPKPAQVETPKADSSRTQSQPRDAPRTEPPRKPPPPAAQARTTPPAGAVEDVASRTERDVEQVLALAALAKDRSDEERVVQVARSMRPGAPPAPTESAALARRLNAEARAAWDRQDIDRALELQQRAFRANPNDAEVTGNLAYFYLKARPARPDLARRLALYALAARGPAFPAGRVEDWGTFAVASSLEGREADAVKAMYVMLTVSRNPERACRAARLAVAQYGPAMKTPAEAMLSRVRRRGGLSNAPSCA